MTSRKNVFSHLLETVGRTLVILSNWSTLAAFVEANMWHFTDPTKFGFSPWATAVLLLCLLLPTFLLFSKKFRNLQLHFSIKFLLTLISPLLLYCASLPGLSRNATARTILLATSVSLSPFVMMWVLRRENSDDIVSKISRCYTKTCMLMCPTTTIPEQEPRPRELSDIGVEVLLGLFAFMSLRWVTISINLFYEANSAALVLLLALSVYASLQAFVDCKYCLGNEGSASRKSTGSTIADDALNETSNTVVDVPSSNSENVALKSVSSDSETPYSPDQQENSTLKLNNIKTDTEPKSTSSLKTVLVWICAVTTGLSSGSAVMLALWIFSSPYVLCRWSGKPPFNNGIAILLAFAAGVMLSIIDPCCKIVQNMSDLPNRKKIRRTILSYFSCLLVFFVVAVASSFILFQETSESAKFIGAFLLTLVLPYIFKLVVKAVQTVSNATSVNLGNGKCMSVVPGIISLVGAFTFFLLHIATVLYINPNFTFMFFANMNVIFGIEIASIILGVIFSSILYFTEFTGTSKVDCTAKALSIPSSCVEHIHQKWESYKSKCVQIIVLFVILGTGLGLAPSYHVKECAYQHSKAIQDLVDVNFGNETTLKVLSWNILLGHDYWGRDNLGCLAPIIKAIQPNIVGLQESDPLPLYWGGKDTLAYLQSYLSPSYSLISGVRPLKSSLGVGLLTDLDILSYYSDILPTDLTVKVPHYSVINAALNLSNADLPQSMSKHSPRNNATLYVINLHAVFKNWTSPPLSNLSRLQINSVVEKIKAIPVTVPVIVMGDFNLNPFESELDVFYDPEFGFKSALNQARVSPKPQTLLNRFAVVDHIFYRGLKLVTSKTLNETDWISDHRPIYAEFEFP